MAVSSEEEKWEGLDSERGEEEDEALSLCDLPMSLIKEEEEARKDDEESRASRSEEEEFNFGSLGGSLLAEPAEMCAADEVFFKGQILPLRLSVSSDSGLSTFRHESRELSRNMSRSESMARSSVTDFPSISSRSSSSGSHYSSTSTSSTTNTTARHSVSTSNSNSKPNRIFSNFHTHPSPKPQIRLCKNRPTNLSSRTPKSSMWEFFRLGLVRAPEIELQDLKARNGNITSAHRSSVSRNSSSSSSNSGSGTEKINSNSNGNAGKNQQDLRKGFLEKRRVLFNGCKCSVNAVETVPLNNIVVIKSGKISERTGQAMEDKKLQELKIKRKMKEKQQQQQKQEGKQALSRHRTFEWLKELSHASYVDES